MTKVFISYSRKDKIFAGRLAKTLGNSELETWIDWEDIPPTADWMDQIHKGIEQADAFLFLLSPDSVASKVCGQEVDHAVQNGKRLIPIVARDVNPNDVHLALAKVNWIYCRESDDFDGAVNKTLSAIRTDLAWVEAHKRLQVRAIEWDKRKDRSLLLRGKDLREAEERLASAGHKDPQPTDLQRQYVLSSRKGEIRTRNLVLVISVIVMVTLAVLSVFAVNQRNAADENALTAVANEHTAQTAQANAEQQAKISRAGELAAQSAAMRSKNPIISYLLGVEAFYKYDNMHVRSSLLENLQYTPTYLEQYLVSDYRAVYSVAFSPDGKLVASGSDSGAVILWDMTTRKPVGQLLGHRMAVYSVAISSDGKLLASGSLDQTIILWDLPNKTPIAQLYPGDVSDRGYTAVYSVAFSPDGKTLASGSNDGFVILWDLATLPPVGYLLRTSGSSSPMAVMSVAFSPDGKTLASGSLNSNITLWDVATRKFQGFLNQGAYALSVTFSPDGKKLASVQGNNWIILWDLDTRTRIGELKGHEGPVRCVAFSPDGKALASGSEDKTIFLWDVETQQINETFSRHLDKVTSLAFSPNGKMLASGSPDTTIIVWNLEPLPRLYRTLAGQENKNNLAFSPDNKILATSSDDHTIMFWDIASLEPIGKPIISNTDTITSLTFSPDSKELVSGSRDRTIIFWDVSTHKPIGQPVTGHTDGVISLTFSHNGSILTSGSSDGTAILWDMATRTRIMHPRIGLKGTIPFVHRIFSPDGTIQAYGGCAFRDINSHWCNLGKITFLDKTAQTLTDLPITDYVNSAAVIGFDPAGKILASAGCTKKDLISGYCLQSATILWDVKTLQPVGLPFSGAGIVFSPNGKLLAGRSSGNLVLWDLDSQSWVEKTCKLVGRNFTRMEWKQYGFTEPYRATCPQWPLEPEVPATPTQ
jgi:WD40 repeat protein